MINYTEVLNLISQLDVEIREIGPPTEVTAWFDVDAFTVLLYPDKNKLRFHYVSSFFPNEWLDGDTGALINHFVDTLNATYGESVWFVDRDPSDDDGCLLICTKTWHSSCSSKDIVDDFQKLMYMINATAQDVIKLSFELMEIMG